MTLFLFASIFDNVGGDLIVGIVSAIATLIGSYIVIRERLLKNELKTENTYDYIDRRNEIFENKIKELQNDITELKELNKEATASLSENTAAIKELKIVLTILKEQLNNSFISSHSKKDPNY